MRPTRRKILAATGVAFSSAVAGCSSGEGRASTETSTGTGTATEAPPSSSDGETTTASATVETAVASEWNVMRARLWDSVSVGAAGDTGAGAAVAHDIFSRFESASGEYGAHEMLESTSESNYATFEDALGALRTDGLEAGDIETARDEATTASTQLAEAQHSLAGENHAEVLELQLLGVTAQNAAMQAETGRFEAAGTTAENLLSQFEAASVHDSLESADSESYESFEGALESIGTAANDEDAEAVGTAAADAHSAAVDGSYAVADSDTIAGTGHIAALQARGWDAAALSAMGGPSADFAHAAALTIYRARAYDCHWLAAQGETEQASTMASDIFAHFEGARAHEALEEADSEAYEGFESGLSDLQSAIENGDSTAIDEAVETVDANLVTGIEALAGSNAPLLEAGFFRARFGDAYELYQFGEASTAATIGDALFERFEANELDFHETVEDTSEDIYETFEETHLSGLIDAFEHGNDDEVNTHYEGVNTELEAFASMAGVTATVSGVEGGYMAARGFDAAAVDALGEDGRAETVAQDAFEHFEGGAGGYHEALEDADESIYESFEEELGAISTAAANGDDVSPVSKDFNTQAVDSIYAVVENGSGSSGDAATSVMEDVFAEFEEATVHELIEDADHNAYETFESALDAYITALEEGGDVANAADTFANAAQYAQFALVDSVEDVPLDLDLAGMSGGGSEEGGESDVQGGPNVFDGEPSEADHVIEMNAVAFDPAELTVSQGDTVAWVHNAGEAHSVSAYDEEIPESASYWASGGFESEDAARTGWESGEGYVQSGQYYTHTFETTGTHDYFCIPHEAAGMAGSITVE